jgi:23S rRNA (adenine2503-C2)-methyltransferase
MSLVLLGVLLLGLSSLARAYLSSSVRTIWTHGLKKTIGMSTLATLQPQQPHSPLHLPQPLSAPFPVLTHHMQGSGKAKIIWNLLRKGIDPLEYSPTDINNSKDPPLSLKAKNLLLDTLNGSTLIPNTIISQTASECGTRKLLLRLSDGLEVETVLIPSVKFDRTTVCVSSQVGCDRACAFCLTATMGFVRNLSADEIIGQVIRGIQVCNANNMPALTNVVFMGMGDAGRNLDQVSAAVEALADGDRLSFAQAKITVSTVGPSPEVFQQIAPLPCSIAWSLHAADDSIRRKLVPSSKYSISELRSGLIQALLSRPSIRTRTIMIALTLIEGVNDRLEDAEKLADFLQPILAIAPKIAIDLIPYNDIHIRDFTRPSRESVNTFQSILRKKGLFCTVRVTRGDSESAACGMLATQSTKRNQVKINCE